MPINLPGVPFKLSPQDMGGFDVSDALSKGFNLNKQFQEARVMPRKLAEELVASQLQNKINKPKAEHAEEITLADLEHTRAGTGLSKVQYQKALMDLKHAQDFRNLLSGNKPPANTANYADSLRSNSSENMSNDMTYGMPNDLNITNAKGIQNVNDFSDNGMPSEGPGPSKSGSAYDTFPGRRKGAQNLKTSLPQNIKPISSEIPSYQHNIATAISLPKDTKLLQPGNERLSHINKMYEEYPEFRKDFEKEGYKKSISIKSDPASGEAFVVTQHPNGMITAQALNVGKSPSTIAQEKEEGKYMGKTYGDAVDASQALSDRASNLDRLAEGLENNPDAKNVIGPFNKNIAQVFGNPADQAYLGEVMAATGNIVLDAAQNIKGSFTGRDQSLINSMKPNANDPYWVFLGKLKGMSELTNLAQQRLDLYADAVHNGVPPHKALEIARKNTDLSKIGDRYTKLIQTAQQREALKEGKMPSFQSKNEADLFLKNISPEEKIKLLNLQGR